MSTTTLPQYPVTVPLQAGPISLLFSNGDLRRLRVQCRTGPAHLCGRARPQLGHDSGDIIRPGDQRHRQRFPH